MSLRTTLREHSFLLAGIALPAAVVLFFLAAQTLPRWWVAPPAYDLLFQVTEYPASRVAGPAADLRVRAGALEVQWTAQAADVYFSVPRLYRWRASDGSVEELELPRPPDLDPSEKSRTTRLPGLDGLRVDTGNPAPDGYEFRNSGRGGSGILNGLFYSRSNEPRALLTRSGRTVVIPDPNTLNYGSTASFLGWLVAEDSPR